LKKTKTKTNKQIIECDHSKRAPWVRQGGGGGGLVRGECDATLFSKELRQRRHVERCVEEKRLGLPRE
jgi:hypothetical protein